MASTVLAIPSLGSEFSTMLPTLPNYGLKSPGIVFNFEITK